MTSKDMNSEVVEALRLAQRLIEEALPKFNWGASALDANAIGLLNETPAAVRQALASLTEANSSSSSTEPAAPDGANETPLSAGNLPNIDVVVRCLGSWVDGGYPGPYAVTDLVRHLLDYAQELGKLLNAESADNITLKWRIAGLQLDTDAPPHTPEDAGTGEPQTSSHDNDAELLRRGDVVAMLRRLAENHADLALYGEENNARQREAMEAALTHARVAVALMPAASPPPPASMGERDDVISWVRYYTQRGADDLGVGEIEKLLQAAQVLALRPPLLPDREGVARIILGKTSAFNGEGYERLSDWAQYPHVANSLTKADDILALLGGVHAE